jgi:integrase
VRFGREICKRFHDYDEAAFFLAGVRFKKHEGSFDARDYKQDNPLGFSNLSDQWLNLKKKQIKLHSWDNLNSVMRRACEAWGQKNIKEIGYGELEDFLFTTLKDHASKSRSNARSVLHSFWIRLVKRRVLHASQLPDFPEVPFELSFRKTIEKEVQQKILDELHRICSPDNLRVWVAVKWLATYISIRLREMIAIKEGEIDRQNGFLIIPHPKEKKPKIIPLTDEDLELVKGMPQGFAELYFFRHLATKSGVNAGEPFGPRYLYKWWMKACDNLGIEGVDLYGGTRHSTAIYLGKFFTPEEIKQATFHTTNKAFEAFERYFRVQPDAIKGMYTKAQAEHRCNTVPIRPKLK